MSGSWNLHNFLLVTHTSPRWSVTFYVRQLHQTPHTICPSNVSPALSAGDEGSSRPVPPPCPPQLPPCPPLSDASVLAGWSRGPASFRLAPVLLGPAHQAPCLPQGRANSVSTQLLANARTQHIRGSRWWTICDIYGLSCSHFWHFLTEAALSHCSAPPPQTYRQWRQSVIGWRRWGWRDIRTSLIRHTWTH